MRTKLNCCSVTDLVLDWHHPPYLHIFVRLPFHFILCRVSYSPIFQIFLVSAFTESLTQVQHRGAAIWYSYSSFSLLVMVMVLLTLNILCWAILQQYSIPTVVELHRAEAPGSKFLTTNKPSGNTQNLVPLLIEKYFLFWQYWCRCTIIIKKSLQITSIFETHML